MNMYSKEQIIDEIKRVSKQLGGKSLTEKDFERHSTIPLSTLRFHLGSWQRALTESGVRTKTSDLKKTTEPRDEKVLLLDLIRLYFDYGEIPTPAMIESKGKFTEKNYKDRWKSIAEAFQIAKEKFPDKFISPLPRKEVLQKDEKLNEMEITDDKTLESNLDEDIIIKVKGEPAMNKDDVFMDAQRIKYIPQTIKPQKSEKSKTHIEPIEFRGLNFAPIDKMGVVYLFGMINQELGFIIEALNSDFPDCEGRRCLDQSKNQWERIKIQIEYKSSDYKESSKNSNVFEKNCDLIVCWKHDWLDSPLEVLELKSTLRYL